MALSSAVLKSKNEISIDIISAIENTSSNEKKKIGFEIIKQTSELNEWNDEKDINYVQNKNIFAEKIFPIGFSNIDQDKIKEKIKKELFQNKDKVKDKLKKLLNKN